MSKSKSEEALHLWLTSLVLAKADPSLDKYQIGGLKAGWNASAEAIVEAMREKALILNIDGMETFDRYVKLSDLIEWVEGE